MGKPHFAIFLLSWVGVFSEAMGTEPRAVHKLGKPFDSDTPSQHPIFLTQ